MFVAIIYLVVLLVTYPGLLLIPLKDRRDKRRPYQASVDEKTSISYGSSSFANLHVQISLSANLHIYQPLE